MRSRPSARGFTLLEIIIAMTILGIIASGVFSAFVFGRRVTTSSQSRLLALELVQQTTEQLRAAIPTGIALDGLRLPAGTYTSANPPPTGQTYLPALAVTDAFLLRMGVVRQYTVRNGRFNGAGVIIWNGTDAVYDIKEVKVKVVWAALPQP